MQSREPIETTSLEEVQRLLGRTLARLESDIRDALGGTQRESDMLRQLDVDRAELEDRVDSLRRTLTRLADVGPLDINRATAEVLDEILLDLEKPLALRVHWAPGLPLPNVAEESLRSLLHRAISLITRHARPGDRVSFRTEREGDEIVLEMRVEPYGEEVGDESFELLAVRCRSLGEFVHELGGRFLLSGSSEHVTLTVRFGVEPHRADS